MAAFEVEVEAICLFLRLLWWGSVLSRDHNAFIYASNSDRNDIVEIIVYSSAELLNTSNTHC